MGFVNTRKAAIGNRVLKGNPVKVNPTSQSLLRHASLRGSALSERVVQLTYGVCTAEAYFRLMVMGLRYRRHRGRAHDAAPSVAASTEVSAMGSRATMTVPLPSELISKLPPSCRILSRIPLIPTPGVPADSIPIRFSAAMPLPLSDTSTRTRPLNRAMLTLAVGLPE